MRNYRAKRPKQPKSSKGSTGLIVSRAGKAFIVETLEGPNKGQRVIAQAKRQLSLLVGDQVVWEKKSNDQGWITDLLPRTNVIERFTGAYSSKQMASNVSALAVIFAPKPSPSANLINQYLVAAEVFNCQAILVLNKYDLIAKQSHLAQELFERYEALGFEVYAISAKSRQGLDALAKALSGHTSILLGQSGVGKSSLVKAWLPSKEISVGAINEQNNLGRHTTSNSTLYHLPSGGMLIDAPGIREFKLSGKHPAETIAKAFPDISPLLSQCKFRDCSHEHEPDCALKSAVKAGELSQARLDEFKYITNSFI